MLVQIMLSQLCGFAATYPDIKFLFCALFLPTLCIHLWKGTVLKFSYVLQRAPTTWISLLIFLYSKFKFSITEILHKTHAIILIICNFYCYFVQKSTHKHNHTFLTSKPRVEILQPLQVATLA